MRKAHTWSVSFTNWRAFIEACRLGSLSAASERLGYTQSAVSRQIAALEREVGVRLLERRSRGVVATPAGAAFYEHALNVVHEADRAARSARSAAQGRPRPLRVGATPSLAAGTVPTALRGLLEAEPELPWSLASGLTPHLRERVAAAELDLAVVTDTPPAAPADDRLRIEPLGSDEMRVLVAQGHRLAGRGSVAIDDLADETWVEDHDGSATLLVRHAAAAGLTLRVDLTAADLPGKTGLVATGYAVALVPGVLVPALRADVVPLRLRDAPRRTISAALPVDDPHPATAALLGLLAAALSFSRDRSG